MKISGYASAVSVATLLLAMTHAGTASAFASKHTPNGEPVRWDSANVGFALSPTLDDIAPGTGDVVAAALASWKGAEGAPALSTFAGTKSDAPGYDGKNIVTYAKSGYAAAGNAIAVTILTYDDSTGRIVDCDIVLNGKYKLAALDRSARAAKGAAAVSTEGGGGVGAGAEFDLLHVVAHEGGHALGLSDEPTDASALMYPFTLPNDASMRAPSSDDVAGIASIYADGVSAPAPQSSGCAVGGSSSAGIPVAMCVGLVALAFARRRRARVALAFLGAFVTLAAVPARATTRSFSAAHAHADVTATNVVIRDGLFTTDVELTIRDCHRAACPSRTTATVWGGHAGGLTQEISGASLPRIGQRVALAFEPMNDARAALVAE